MLQRVKSIGVKFGFDRAIAYTVLSRLIQAFGGILTIVLIARFLSITEQGYYFTFSSILAIQVFFELGLTTIITQFTSYEAAHLTRDEGSEFNGPRESLSRLSSILHFCVKWFVSLGLLLVIILIIVGFIFFNKYGKNALQVEWQLPWIVVSIATSLSLIMAPILAFQEGMGKIREVAKVRLIQQSIQILVLLILLISGFKLLASPIAAMAAFFVIPCWLLATKEHELLLSIWKKLDKWKINYSTEIFPFQWKIAISWLSGYFIFQLFNPVLFATEGAVIAGQMGMTLAALSGVMSISMSWINTKIPLFSSLIAKENFHELDYVFNKSIVQACLVSGLGLSILILIVSGLQYYHLQAGQRFLPLQYVVLLSFATFVNQYINGLATYLRCHKSEPFLFLSIVVGLLIGTSTIVLGNLYGVKGIVIGYATVIVFVSLTWAKSIYNVKKKQWHGY